MMNSEQFRDALKRLEISQKGFARMIKSDPRTIRRYALGELPVPNVVEIILWMMKRHPELIKWLPLK